jgi:hypothetical protein
MAKTDYYKGIKVASNEKPLTPEEAIKFQEAENKAKRGRQAADTRLKQEKAKAGKLAFEPIRFMYASGKKKGHGVWIKVQTDSVTTMLIPPPIDGTLEREGTNVAGFDYVKTRGIQVSYGKKVVARKKPLGAKGLKKGASNTKKLVQAWKTIPVPADATFFDCVAFVSSFKKKPAMMKDRTQRHVFDFSKLRALAGANGR